MNDLPKWIVPYSEFFDYSLKKGSKIHMGVVADTWEVIDELGNAYIIKKTEFRNYKIKTIIANLEIAQNLDVLPNHLQWFIDDTILIIIYPKIKGVVKESLNKLEAENTFKILSDIHKSGSLFFHPVESIYSSILKISQELILIEKKQSFEGYEEIITLAANRVLANLSCERIKELLDCRGRLTHGDVKPNNLVITKNKISLIDWEKLCSVSPEFDIAYFLLYTPIIDDVSLTKLIKKYDIYNHELLVDALNYVHDFHLLYDFMVYLKTRSREEYIKRTIIPMWSNWESMKLNYLEAMKCQKRRYS